MSDIERPGGFAQDQLRDLAAATRAEPDPRTRALLLRPVFDKAVAAGFLKGLIPVPFGGAASSGVDAAIFVEEWAAQCPDFVMSMGGPLIALLPVYEVGTPEQVERFVRPFLADSGAPLAAMAFSEPEGSANFDAEGPGQGDHRRKQRRRAPQAVAGAVPHPGLRPALRLGHGLNAKAQGRPCAES
jgi:nitroalkane oxidase